MKDTLKNRMKAIEAAAASNTAFDIDVYVCLEDKRTKKELERMLVEANKILTDIYLLSHGHNSKCCKGKGADLIEPWIKTYF